MNRKLLLSLFLFAFITAAAQYPRASLWTGNMSNFASQDAVNGIQKNVVLFAGSSTFTNWGTLKTDFPDSKILNRSFGGSWMTDLIYYFNQVVAPYTPSQVVLYEGDNDLYGTSKTAEGFMEDVITMTRMINIYFPNAKILLVSIKPSPSRASIFPTYLQANALMKSYADKYDNIEYADTWTPMLNANGNPDTSLFGPDMLHMNTSGYAIWKSVLKPFLVTSTSGPELSTDKTIFTESSHATYHDPSWVNTTFPSTFSTNVAGKISCDSNYFHNGSTSLRLSYRGIEGGNWKACIAAADWVPFDISQSEVLEFYAFSETKVDSIDLPAVYIESFTSTTTNKLRLAKYISEIPANTWTKISIPVENWKSLSPAFSYDNVKTIFFTQQNPNNNPVIFYVDDIIFRAKSGTSPGGNSSGDIYIDFGSDATTTPGNWNNVTDHQTANMDLIDDLAIATGITLKITDPFYNGYNTTGTTTTTGDAAIFPSTAASDNFFGHGLAWSPNPANPEGIFTLNGLDTSKKYSFTVFASRTGVSDNRETLYTFTGANTKTSALNPSNNTTNVSLVENITPDQNGVISIKCEAGPNNNNSNKFYFIGAMRVKRSDRNTSVNPAKANTFKAHYSNGLLNIEDYTGDVKVYFPNGTLFMQGQAVFGKLNIYLSKGAYIIKTNAGISKLLVF